MMNTGPWMPGITQTVSFSATAGVTAAHISSQATIVRIAVTTACFVAFSPVTFSATTAGVYLPAGGVEYFQVPSSSFISAIRATADGVMYVTEMSH